MQSPFKRILVYDLETGGLNFRYNSITEVAIVAIDSETLEIVDEMSVMLKPRIDVYYLLEEEDNKKIAKTLFGNLATPDDESNIKTLNYKGNKITLKSLDLLVEDIEIFRTDQLEPNMGILDYEQYKQFEGTIYEEIAEVFFNNAYNPQALEVTHIGIDLLLEEGIEFEQAFKLVEEFVKKHTIANSKPVRSGHNIKGFDDQFMEKFFSDNGSKFFNAFHSFYIDTLEWARIKWFEMPSFNLGVCANEVGLTLKEAHRALPDTVANANFLIKILKSLRGEGSQESKYQRRKLNFNF